jgi:uncharacterized protein (TIGR03437 family)
MNVKLTLIQVALVQGVLAQNITVSPARLTQTWPETEGAPVTATLTISGAGSMVSVTGATDSAGNWLITSPATGGSGGNPQTVSVILDPSGLPDGMYTGTVSIGNRPAAVTVPVTMMIGDPGPQLPAEGIVNGASFQGNAVAPGEIVTLFGTKIGPRIPYLLQIWDRVVQRKLAGTRVWFDNTAAPLIYAYPNQVAAVVPYDVAGKQTVQVRVENMVARSLPVTLPVQDAAPALFTANMSGKGPIAALNQDYSVNSAANPAPKASFVMLFATGAGVMDPGVADGSLVFTDTLPRPLLPVHVTIGGRAAEIWYAGAAPQLISGVLQVNARIPPAVTSGAVPIVLTVGNFSSPDGCTIAVE